MMSVSSFKSVDCDFDSRAKKCTCFPSWSIASSVDGNESADGLATVQPARANIKNNGHSLFCKVLIGLHSLSAAAARALDSRLVAEDAEAQIPEKNQ